MRSRVIFLLIEEPDHFLCSRVDSKNNRSFDNQMMFSHTFVKLEIVHAKVDAKLSRCLYTVG